ncbi:hypothetical protein Tco_0640529 [Tanacetum coccineum]
MRTRSSNRRRSRQQQQQLTPVIVEVPEIPMADTRTMAELLQAPTGGFENAIVIPPFQAKKFELKPSLITLVQSKVFRGTKLEEPHNHIRFIESITNNFRYPHVPITTVKLLLFHFSIDGAAKTWLDKEPPQSILTWEDLIALIANAPKMQQNVKRGLLRTKRSSDSKSPYNRNMLICSAIIMNNVPEKLEDLENFLSHVLYKNSIGLFSKDDRLVAGSTILLMILLPILILVKTMIILKVYPLTHYQPGVDVSILKKDSHEGNFQAHSNPLLEFDDNLKSSTINPLFDEMEEDVEIENSNKPVLLQTPLSDKGYYDQEGDALFLESLLCEDTTLIFAVQVISDHDTSISFSPRSDPLHHEFAGELLHFLQGLSCSTWNI